MTEYPELKALKEIIIRKNLHLSVDNEVVMPAGSEYIMIRFKASNEEIMIPVMDEYHDTDGEYPMMLLQLVLQEIEQFEEAEDFRSWAHDLGLDAGDSKVRDLYVQIQEASPRISMIVGDKAQAISSWHMQMNSGPAKALRALKK